MGSISHRLSIAWPPAAASEPTSTLVLTTPKRRFIDLRASLPLTSKSLYWGIAGTSSYDPATRTGTWTHWIDSRTDEPASDSGVMETLQNGDVLETGTMLDFDDGRVKRYEEVWRDEMGLGTRCVAVECGMAGCRGMGVILGDWCQVLVKRDGEVSAGRWKRGEDGVWREEFRVGRVINDEFRSMLEGQVEEKKTLGGLEWVVVERHNVG
ncbi:hypothetical protein EX30DRAFT_126792 [Ascodesmis nigricans]|uniref:Protein HRI1 n=1 Tax=Ascodesmis nigricans TaxID=341454 RepID=A0A4S2MSL4_9PEZI|nr:hypothetical protein EX30DRAFT_126792 [Ascodesmis nigricans]